MAYTKTGGTCRADPTSQKPRAIVGLDRLKWRNADGRLFLYHGNDPNPLVTIEPDSKYSGMYRIRFPDGGLSDMANLTRAKDAASSHCENSTLGVSGRKKRLRLPATFTKCGGRLRAPPILSARLLKALLRRTCREAPQQHQRPVRRPSHRNVGITGLPCAVEVCPHGT